MQSPRSTTDLRWRARLTREAIRTSLTDVEDTSKELRRTIRLGPIWMAVVLFQIIVSLVSLHASHAMIRTWAVLVQLVVVGLVGWQAYQASSVDTDALQLDQADQRILLQTAWQENRRLQAKQRNLQVDHHRKLQIQDELGEYAESLPRLQADLLEARKKELLTNYLRHELLHHEFVVPDGVRIRDPARFQLLLGKPDAMIREIYGHKLFAFDSFVVEE